MYPEVPPAPDEYNKLWLEDRFREVRVEVFNFAETIDISYAEISTAGQVAIYPGGIDVSGTISANEISVGTFVATGDISIDGTILAGGNVFIDGSLDVSGAIDCSVLFVDTSCDFSDVGISGDCSIDSTLTVGGDAAFHADVSMDLGLLVDGSVKFTGDVSGAGIQFVDRGDPAAKDWDETDLSTVSTWYDLSDITTVVPSGAQAVLFRVKAQHAAAAHRVYFREPGNVNNVNTAFVWTQGAGVRTDQDIVVACTTDGRIEWASDQSDAAWTSVDVVVRGWWV